MFADFQRMQKYWEQYVHVAFLKKISPNQSFGGAVIIPVHFKSQIIYYGQLQPHKLAHEFDEVM